MVDDRLTEKLHRQFISNGYTWNIDGVLTVPTQEDIRQTLDKVLDLLYNEEVPTQAEVGRMIVSRWDEDNFDIYLLIGSL